MTTQRKWQVGPYTHTIFQHFPWASCMLYVMILCNRINESDRLDHECMIYSTIINGHHACCMSCYLHIIKILGMVAIRMCIFKTSYTVVKHYPVNQWLHTRFVQKKNYVVRPLEKYQRHTQGPRHLCFLMMWIAMITKLHLILIALVLKFTLPTWKLEFNQRLDWLNYYKCLFVALILLLFYKIEHIFVGVN